VHEGKDDMREKRRRGLPSVQTSDCAVSGQSEFLSSHRKEEEDIWSLLWRCWGNLVPKVL